MCARIMRSNRHILSSASSRNNVILGSGILSVASLRSPAAPTFANELQRVGVYN